MLLPILGVIALMGGSTYAVSKRRKKIVGMTPERQKLFQGLLTHQKDPSKLRFMATKFEGEGLAEEGLVLRKLADIRELPKEEQDERREIFRRAMKSTNREAIMNLAAVYDKDGCIGAAAALRVYASGLAPKAD